MLCNIRREIPPCAGSRNSSRTTRARMRVHTRDPPHPRPCICTRTCVHTYIDVPVVYVFAVYAPEDQPPDLFRRRISVFPFPPPPLLLFFFPSFFLSASRSPRRATIHLSSSFIYDRKSRDRVGNNVPEKKLRKEKNFLRARFFFLSYSCLYVPLFCPFLARQKFHRSTLHVFAEKRTRPG